MIDFHPHAESCYRCDASAWELVGEFVPLKGLPQDVIVCAFCGARLRVKATRRPASEPLVDDDFRFQFGRFAGKTIAEADAEPNGRRYLEVMRDTNEKLRGRITEYLEKTKASAV